MKKQQLFPLSIFIMLFLSIVLTSFAPGKWTAPASADALVNPLKGNVASIADAKKIYDGNCAVCHGSKGKGDGAAAPGLSKPPADHTSAAVQSQSDGAIFWKITEGNSPMPAYKQIYNENQRWSLVNYIRTLAKSSKK